MPRCPVVLPARLPCHAVPPRICAGGRGSGTAGRCRRGSGAAGGRRRCGGGGGWRPRRGAALPAEMRVLRGATGAEKEKMKKGERERRGREE